MKKKFSRDSMENLPLEIIENILSRLPLDSQPQCREVCTRWRTLIPKPKMGLIYGVSTRQADEIEARFYFSEQDNHVDDYEEQVSCLGTLTKYDHSLIMPVTYNIVVDYRTFMVGSCNGLVCYAGYAISTTCQRKVYICNPLTGEHIEAPASNGCRMAYLERVIGFGYNRSSNEYKILRVMSSYRSQEPRDGRIRVYTFERSVGVWKNKCSVIGKHLLPQLGSLPSVGVFACGALHWIAKNSITIKPRVVAFNLEHETFYLLPLITCVGQDVNCIQLMVLGGNLCVLEVIPNKHITIWESSKYIHKGHGNTSPWITRFTIAWEDYRSWLEPSAPAKKVDECLLWYNAVLSCYDPKIKTFRHLAETLKETVDNFKRSVYTTSRAVPHVNSTVSLTAAMGKERKRKRK